MEGRQFSVLENQNFKMNGPVDGWANKLAQEGAATPIVSSASLCCLCAWDCFVLVSSWPSFPGARQNPTGAYLFWISPSCSSHFPSPMPSGLSGFPHVRMPSHWLPAWFSPFPNLTPQPHSHFLELRINLTDASSDCLMWSPPSHHHHHMTLHPSIQHPT